MPPLARSSLAAAAADGHIVPSARRPSRGVSLFFKGVAHDAHEAYDPPDGHGQQPSGLGCTPEREVCRTCARLSSAAKHAK